MRASISASSHAVGLMRRRTRLVKSAFGLFRGILRRFLRYILLAEFPLLRAPRSARFGLECNENVVFAPGLLLFLFLKAPPPPHVYWCPTGGIVWSCKQSASYSPP